MASTLLTKLQSLDLNPKLAKDAAVRTKSGAALSLISLLLSGVLLISELSYYWSTEKVEYMEVDPIRGATMRINFDVTFPSMPCAVVSLDAMDASGHNTLDILHDVFKRRLDKTGAPIGASTKGEMNTLKSKDELLREKQRIIADGVKPTAVTDPNYCGDCYGAGIAGQCCNTCEEVRAVYRYVLFGRCHAICVFVCECQCGRVWA